jgi:pilus assembly protein CpaC
MLRLVKLTGAGGLIRVAGLVGVLLSGGALFPVSQALAQTPRSTPSNEATIQHVVVIVNKSRTITVDQPFSSAVVGAKEIADVLPMSDRTLYIQGKKVGTTNVSVFDQGMHLIKVLDLEVGLDTGNLQGQIRSSTSSLGIQVSNSNGQVVLSGVAANAVAADRAVQLAKSLSPDGTIVNAMQVAPSQQVMLRVRFLEASRQAERDLGVNWFVADKTSGRGVNTGVGSLTSAGAVTPATNGVPVFQTAGTLVGTTSQPFGVALANLLNKGTSVDVLVSALENKGLVRRLAEPDLVALSGDTAAFLAGGEFPVPSVQPGSAGGFATITVDYKPFGIQLTFAPTVLANGIINLRLTPSVSELDFTQAITISGFQIPSLVKREARTTVELRDGQSFAIAGLLSSENRKSISQLPWIGSVPVLGALFRSDDFQQQETDLVVIVTPHLVAPAAPGQRLATPFDQQVQSNDADFFINGEMELKKKYNDYVTTGGDLQGPYGHLLGVGDATTKK